MAVLRQEINASIGAKDTRTVANVQVQDAAYRPEQVVRVGESTSWRTNLVESIASTAVRVGEKMVGVAQENAYLEGQAKAGRIQSEEELDSNWLTKDWAVAGYRDTMGKLALADTESKMVTDMTELRTKSPAEMEAYLTKRREELTPIFSSLSREARANMFGQLLTSDRTAMVKHAGEHKAYILDNINTGIRASVMTGLTSMQSLQTAAMLDKNKVEDYHKGVEQFAANVYTSVWGNPAFKNEKELKGKLTAEALHMALDADQLAAFEYFRDRPFKDADGNMTNLLASLPEGEMVKLSRAYSEAKKRTTQKREGALLTQKAQYESGLQQGESTATWEEHSMLRDRLIAGGILTSPDSVSSFDKMYFDSRSKYNDAAGIASALVRGDTQYLVNSGKSAQEAGAIQEELWAKQARAGQPVPIVAQMGVLKQMIDNGNAEVGGKMLAARVGPSLMQLSRPDGTIDAQHAEIVNTYSKMYDVANPTQRTQMLAGFPAEQQSRFVMMREALRTLPMDAALKRVTAIEERNAKLSKQELAAMSQVKDTEIAAEITNFNSQGLVMSWKNALGFTAEQRAKAVLQPDDRLWGNTTQVKDAVYKMRTEIAAEASALRLTNPEIDAEGLVAMAAGNVAARTVRTKQGPLFLPRDTNPNKFFGVRESIPTEIIAKAVDKVVKPQVAGNGIRYEVGLGQIAWSEYDVDGEPTSRAGVLDPKSVSGAVEELLKTQEAKSSAVHGTGKTVRNDTAAVTFNGENTAGVDPYLMFKFRDTLVKNEGVRNTVYKDTKGNQTIGVGIANKAYFPKVGPDGKIDQATIDSTFRRASSDAAVFGQRAVEQLGLQRSESAFLLFSEFAYQGTGGTFKEMAQAIARKDKEAALAALKTTKAYDYSGASRKAHYEKLVTAALEGK